MLARLPKCRLKLKIIKIYHQTRPQEREREKLRILIKHDDQHENVIKLIFLYRNQDPMQRKEYVKMHDDVIEAGGDVKIFSSMHVSGERKSHFYCV